MTPITTYLTFPDKAAFLATLDASFVRQGETGAPLPDGVSAIRIVGTQYNSDGTYDAEGNVITPPTVIPGFHVNVLTTNDGADPLPDTWAPYQVPSGQGVFG